MNQHRLVCTLLIACSSMAFAICAEAAVTECLDAAGVTTYTDAPCKLDETRAPELNKPLPAKEKISLQAAPFAAAENARALAWAAKPKTSRGMTLDIVTLKAARESMITSDRANALARQQILARL